MYIGFEGPIGAGKTTLTELLANQLGGQTVLEDFDNNPFLPDFYRAKDRWGLAMQLWFLSERYAQLSQVKVTVQPAVADHTLLKDRVFAQALLSGRELNLYERISQAMHEDVEYPTVVVFLDARNEILLQRIKRRGRDYEKDITADYLDALRASYAEQFSKLPSTLMRVDTSDLDLGSEQQLRDLFEKIVSTTRTAQRSAEIAHAC